ncbi:MAG: ThuA domain-containing protein [Fibrobacteria bacterium]
MTPSMKSWLPRAIYALLFAGAHWGPIGLAQAAPPSVTNLKKILVLDKSQGGVNGHLESRRDFNKALQGLAADKGFSITYIGQNDPATLIASEFSPEKLATYQAVLFCYNDGVDAQLDSRSKTNIETYVENGGGLLPIHSAQDFVTNWPWYTRSLVQSFYGPHGTNQPQANVAHDSEGTREGTETKGIFRGLTAPDGFLDEFYSFRTSPRDSADVTILLTVDERSFTRTINAPMGDDHPVMWTKTVGKGRVVNFSLGHSWSTSNVYTEKNSYLTRMLYATLRYLVGDFTGCTDNAFLEYNPDATRSAPDACKQSNPVSLADPDGSRPRPLIFREAGKPFVTVSFRHAGPHEVLMVDVSGRVVQARKGAGPSVYSLSIPAQSGIYTVVAKSGGQASRYRVTVL